MACKCNGKCVGLPRSNYTKANRCQVCEKWYLKSDKSRCSCCNQILRSRPRNGLRVRTYEVKRIA